MLRGTARSPGVPTGGVWGWLGTSSCLPFTSCPLGAWRWPEESTQGDRAYFPHRNPVRNPPLRSASCREAQAGPLPSPFPAPPRCSRLTSLSLSPLAVRSLGRTRPHGGHPTGREAADSAPRYRQGLSMSPSKALAAGLPQKVMHSRPRQWGALGIGSRAFKRP